MRICLNLIASLALLLISGCTLARADQSSLAKPTATQPAYIVHCPGIGGPARIDEWMVQGLRDGGLPCDLFLYNWMGNDRGLKALTSYKRNHEQAAALAERIVGIIKAHPEKRVILTAHSGGNAIIIWALEKLPDHVQVDTLLMLSPALSPNYDLSKALKHVKGNAYSFYSQHDNIVLGFGTEQFGTMEGVKIAAAGHVGFSKPASADSALYAKLQQFPHDDSWAQWENNGGHVDDMKQPFAREVLAPLLITGELRKGSTTQPIK